MLRVLDLNTMAAARTAPKHVITATGQICQEKIVRMANWILLRTYIWPGRESF